MISTPSEVEFDSAPVNITVDHAVAQLYFIEVDHLNTPRLIADATGQTVWKWDQTEPFADSVADENPSGVGPFEFPLRRAGEYADKESNAFYNSFRDLDPALGRYMQFDLLGLSAGLNGYLHVQASPLLLTDPRGLQPVAPVNPGLLFPPAGGAGGGVPSPLGKPKDDGSMGGLFPPGTFSQGEGGKSEPDAPSPESIIEGSRVPPFPGLSTLAECTKGSTMVDVFDGAVVHDHFRPGPPKRGGD